MRAKGHPVVEWSNAPGYTYATHSHPYTKVLCCLEGSIVFHLDDHDVALSAGDRTIVEPEAAHSATVGPAGVRCAEAHVL
jgi:quercetin dioxygenase-like cupin family protein